MKIIPYILLATAAALSAHAESLGFIKVGETYNVQFAMASSKAFVLSDEGGGWYCCRSNGGAITFLNFNLAIEISDPYGGNVSPTKAPPASKEKSPEIHPP